MKKRTINLFVLGLATLTIALFGCSSGNVADTTATGAAVDGAALYNSDCIGCHGPLATSGKKGASVSQIQDAIAHNWGGMGAFASLSTDQLQAIATALAPVTTTTPATTASLDGAVLYADNCSSCHGPLATSGKGGALASAIQTAIAGNYGGMGRFSNLTTAQLQAIADALASVQASTPPPATTDGAALYAQYCSSCHGALATSAKLGATVSRIQAGISGVNAMKSLSNLTSTQIQAIATALGTTSSGGTSSGGTTTSTDGASLYTQYCQGCHGSLAASSKAGRTATQIQTAIGSVGSMSSLSALTATQVQAIAAALATASTPAPTDGAALYTSYCSSCHGALASSSVRGSSASTISSALSNVSQMMSISLTTTQIQAIATALGTTTTPSPTPAPSPSTTDGATLYGTYCASCHGPLATSTKSGATAAQIQTGISNNLGGMGQFSNLTSTQVQAIAAALSTGTAPTTTPVCGSCHAIPPSTGHHSYHVNSQGLSCGTCHGTGYSSTTVNTATHNNGVINISSTPGWNPSTRTCSNSCHGTERW